MSSRNREVVSRPAGGRRHMIDIATVWAVAVAAVLLFAHVTAVGPILVELTRTHGIHLGDVVFTLLAVAVAALITARLLRRR